MLTRGIWTPRTVALFAVVALGTASVLYALPNVGGEVEFYDSAAHINQVGDWVWNCDSTVIHWGIKTQYGMMIDGFACSHPEYCCHFHSSGFYTDCPGACVWHDTGSGIECETC